MKRFDEICTCRIEIVHSASIDPPERIVDKYCPIHSDYDVDAHRESRMESVAEQRAERKRRDAE